MKEKKKCLVISVGGTPEQCKKSIEYNQPEYVVFLCSEQTYSSAGKIAAELMTKEKIKDYERIITPDAEILSASYLSLVHELPDKLSRFGMTMEDITVDYTGGTKSMTAALVLATVKKCNSYSYIGGESRTKNGTGIVVDGKERVLFQDNPWNTAAINELPVIDTLFNKARYAALSERLEEISALMEGPIRIFYLDLAKIVKGYDAWDSFRYGEAVNSFKAIDKWERFDIIDNNHLREFMNKVKANIHWIDAFQKVKKNTLEYSDMLLKDLISNAIRRAELEEKYDDAVIRLYSSIEKYAKSCLLGYGINNARTLPHQVPEELKGRFTDPKTDRRTGEKYYDYGFELSCRMLCLHDMDFCIKYNQIKDRMRDLMGSRNNSILVHGLSPINRTTYEKMLEIVMEFSDLDKGSLIRFPEMNAQLWGPVLKRAIQ